MTDVLCMCWGERQGILLVLTHSSHVASCVGVRVALYLFSHTSSMPVRAMSSPSSSHALKFANRWIFLDNLANLIMPGERLSPMMVYCILYSRGFRGYMHIRTYLCPCPRVQLRLDTQCRFFVGMWVALTLIVTAPYS